MNGAIGIIDIEDVRGVYNASRHPDVLTGRKTEDTILAEFLTNFEGPGGTKDGIITVEEFESYYSNISASIDDDDYFELMLRNAWHISGGKGSYANSTNRRVLVTHDDGRQSVEEIQNDIGLRRDDTVGIASRLKAQGISVANINTNGAPDGTRGKGVDRAGYPHSQIQLQNQYQRQQQDRQQQALERQQPRAQGKLQQPQQQYQVQPQQQVQQLQLGRTQQHQHLYQQSSRSSSSRGSGSVGSQGSSSQRMRPRSLGEHLQY